MAPESQPTLVVCAPIMGSDLSPVGAFEPAIRVIDANQRWEAFQAAARGADTHARDEAKADLVESLAQADIVCMAFPAMRDIATVAPKMQWLHHTQAGVSNLWPCDVWQAEHVTITSGRGHVKPTAMAEYAIAGMLHFARGMQGAVANKQEGRLNRSAYDMRRIEGSTLGVVGLGGIGKETARLGKALGMSVLATRRSVEAPQENVDHADVLMPASALGEMAAQCDFLAVCTQLTQETTHLIDAAVLARMKPSAVITNVSRGEVIDEDALIAALQEGRIAGAVLDVYDGELAGKPPRPELMALPNVLLTPHLSAGGEAITGDNAIMALFCENLRRYLAGEELLNVVDRARGY
jgi:phosphoglycerate dehydrogenase-like enzyme